MLNIDDEESQITGADSNNNIRNTQIRRKSAIATPPQKNKPYYESRVFIKYVMKYDMLIM
jgi:hypothetical protein